MNLLIEHEAWEDSKTTIERDRLSDSECTHTKREGEWGQRRESDNSHTSQKGAAHVQEFVGPWIR